MNAVMQDLRASLRAAIAEWQARRALRRSGLRDLGDTPAPF